ncbi:MAG: DUF2911 domain-containing protein [Flavobacteriales bacterium]|nr:DUF2911 domain-containing protein [Flavobacteriales bacterium]
MKHLITMALLAAPVLAIAQKLPQPSPKGSIEQIVGLTTIKVEYSRPSVKGRVIFGDLVPYGEVWRTGANKCTTIEFDGEAMVEEQPVKAGKYSLFTIPSEDTWVVILNSNSELGSPDERKPEEDVLMAKVQRGKVGEPVETFTIGFEKVVKDGAELVLSWEHMRVAVRIHADATKQALINIKEALAKPDADYRAYHSSARFCVDRGLQIPDALTWAQKSVSLEKKYWNTHTLALAQAANGNYKEAIAAANESITLAQAEKDENYVKMNRERIEEWTKAMQAKNTGSRSAPAAK